MSQFFQHLEEEHGFHMDGRMRESFARAEILLDFRTATFKTTRRRDVIPLPRSVRALHKCNSRTRRRRKTITHLLNEQVLARRGNAIQPTRETRLGTYHGCSKTQTVLPEPSHHRLDILPFKEHSTQTRTLRPIDKMGRRAERISH